jgi:hypothetical protein
MWCVVVVLTSGVCCPRNNFFFNALRFVCAVPGDQQHPLPERHDLGMAFSSAWHRAEGFKGRDRPRRGGSGRCDYLHEQQRDYESV